MTPLRSLILALIISLASPIWSQAQSVIQPWRWTDPDTALRIAGWPAVKPGDYKVQNSVRTLSYEHPDGHEATVKARTLKTVQSYTVTLTASDSAPLDYAWLTLPGAAGKADTVLSAFAGGMVYPKPPGWKSGNGGGWPDNYAFYPGAQFYDSDKGAGIQILAFNNELRSLSVNWWTHPGGVVPEIGMHARLDPGQSTVYTIELRYFAKGLPEAGAVHYRDAYLLKWLTDRGRRPVKWKVEGPWAYIADPWINGGRDTVAWSEKQVAKGAKGIAMWSRADGVGGPYYEPDHRRYENFGDYAKAAKLSPFGALVNPYVHDTAGREANLASPHYRKHMEGLAEALASAGVSYAFWDTGSHRDGLATIRQRIEIGEMFLSRGIHLSPESAGDISMVMFGSATQYHENPPLLPRIVTPEGTYFVISEWIEPGRIEAVGAIPMLTDWQLEAAKSGRAANGEPE